jgi:hypothetical protein
MEYSREKAIELYGRVQAWERSQSNRLREQILVPIFSGNMCVLHNSVIAAEEGKPWLELPKDYPAKARYYEWKQEQIWKATRRLQAHFARFF